MRIYELAETKKKTDVKWIAKLKDGKTKTIWALDRADAKQKLGTSIMIQGGYTLKKAPLKEFASMGGTSSGAIATVTAPLMKKTIKRVQEDDWSVADAEDDWNHEISMAYKRKGDAGVEAFRADMKA